MLDANGRGLAGVGVEPSARAVGEPDVQRALSAGGGHFAFHSAVEHGRVRADDERHTSVYTAGSRRDQQSPSVVIVAPRLVLYREDEEAGRRPIRRSPGEVTNVSF